MASAILSLDLEYLDFVGKRTILDSFDHAIHEIDHNFLAHADSKNYDKDVFFPLSRNNEVARMSLTLHRDLSKRNADLESRQNHFFLDQPFADRTLVIHWYDCRFLCAINVKTGQRYGSTGYYYTGLHEALMLRFMYRYHQLLRLSWRRILQ